MRLFVKTLLIAAATTTLAHAAGVMQYGDADCLGMRTYPSDPRAGAVLNGLAPNAVSRATLITTHTYPFSPSANDYPGTDRIYVGATQTASHDGYSRSAQRVRGPQRIELDYSSLVDGPILSLTLGYAADDFQRPVIGNTFYAKLNGIAFPAMADVLNSVDQTTPKVQFLTFGVPLSMLTPDHRLLIEVGQGGDGGDGFATDFLTVGVTTVPGVGTGAVMVAGGLMGARRRRW